MLFEHDYIHCNSFFFADFDQKLVIDHRKYDGTSAESPVDRSDEDINYTYPDEVQLVPNVPVSPQSPKYTLVPIRKLPSSTPQTEQDDPEGHAEEYTPTIPSDFQQEIAKIRIPHTGLPGFITDPPPPRDEEEGGEYDEDEGNYDNDDNEEPNNDHYFTDDFLEPPGGEFREPIRSTTPRPLVPFRTDLHSRDVKIIVKNQPQKPHPLLIQSFPSVPDTTEPYNFEEFNAQVMTPEELRQFQTKIKHNHKFSIGHPPYAQKGTLVHYGPPQPIPAFKQFNHGLAVVRRPVVQRSQRPRVYIRYPRNYKTYYHHPVTPYNRVKVMTQSFVYHPKEYYQRLRSPVMMSATSEFRNTKKSPRKKKKKKKEKSANGECKPKKIIKEIHFHHYDPQLSAQLAPLEGINFKDGEDYENDIKVITKETEIEDEVKKGHKGYARHNDNLEKEIDKHRAETERRLLHPEYYSSSYNPHYPDSGSTEYIDYNVKTDSTSSSFHGHDRSFTMKPPKTNLRRPKNSTSVSAYSTHVPLQNGQYMKHQVVKYFYKTPDSAPKT